MRHAGVISGPWQRRYWFCPIEAWRGGTEACAASIFCRGLRPDPPEPPQREATWSAWGATDRDGAERATQPNRPNLKVAGGDGRVTGVEAVVGALLWRHMTDGVAGAVVDGL